MFTFLICTAILGSGLSIEYGDRLRPYVRGLRARRRQAAAMRAAVAEELQRPRVGWLAEIGYEAERHTYNR